MAKTPLIDRLRMILRDGAQDCAREPDANPVSMAAYEVSHGLEAGDVTMEAVAGTAKILCDAAFLRRAKRLSRYAAPDDLAPRLRTLADADPVRFKAMIAKPRAGVVFTAHPTFALSRAVRAQLAELAEADDEGAVTVERHGPDAPITIAMEHADTQQAMGRVQDALKDVHHTILSVLRAADPAGWRAVTPRLITLAHWVGYDLDGRTDIQWYDTFRFRLSEKALQLRRYAENAGAILNAHGPVEALAAFADAAQTAADLAAADAERFAKAGEGEAATIAAANALTRDEPGKLVHVDTLLTLLSTALDGAQDIALAEAIWLLRADVAAFGLGTGHIHLRINAAQISNAVRADVDIDPDATGFGRLALDRAARHALDADLTPVNFASVFLEQATARRQMMLAAQIRKHIDADAPIRFLIAETESPVTVVAAVALARQYGVADGVDISPLFETPTALEAGGRLIEQLLDEPAYLDYARTRGRMAMQIGYSDSGRFMGQVAAGLAAERLQILAARALSRRDIRDLDVVIFNTHGESLGRGAHPGGMTARLDYVLPPWVRARFADERIGLIHETSFQGGDGMMHFATPARAASSLTAIVAAALDAPGETARDDRFYTDLNFTWDFYRALKAWHEDLRDDADHQAILTSMGPNLLFKTGSRPVKRASALRTAGPAARSLRAIPHNAILQQLGAPANVAGGVGHAAGIDPDRFVEMVEASPRAQTALALAATARGLTSIRVMHAYGRVFDPVFWTARAHSGAEPDLRAPAEALADRLRARRRASAYARFANRLSADIAHFDDVIDRAPTLKAQREARSAEREDLELLHGLRLALIMRAFVLVARLPSFSDRFDVTREGLIDMVLDLQIEDAAALLEQIFPRGGNGAALIKAVEEEGEAAGAPHGYPEINDAVIGPLRRVFDIIREIGVGVAHAYDAYG